MNGLDDLKKRVQELIDQGTQVRSTANESGRVDESKNMHFGMASLSFLIKVFGEEHPYAVKFSLWEGGSIYDRVDNCLAILKAVQDELEGGWLFTARGLASAEVFSDFLDMASYFLAEDYKDPAAVIAGAALEQHLRQLCRKNAITTEWTDAKGRLKYKMGGSLNDELAKAQVYQKADHKSVVMWLDIRNNAAHGKFGEYSKAQVELMVQGIKDFMARNPL